MRQEQAESLLELVESTPWGREDAQATQARVEFSGSRDVHAVVRLERIESSKAAEARSQLSTVLPKDAVDTLLSSEERIFAWLGEHESHPARFVLDPVGSLEAAGVKLGERARGALLSRRTASKRVAKGQDEVNLASLRVEIAQKPKRD